jgi:hypothetical protein
MQGTSMGKKCKSDGFVPHYPIFIVPGIFFSVQKFFRNQIALIFWIFGDFSKSRDDFFRVLLLGVKSPKVRTRAKLEQHFVVV